MQQTSGTMQISPISSPEPTQSKQAAKIPALVTQSQMPKHLSLCLPRRLSSLTTSARSHPSEESRTEFKQSQHITVPRHSSAQCWLVCASEGKKTVWRGRREETKIGGELRRDRR
ncbi:hypothetical protein Mapa_008009 [Marchantia paleacea]|nr:hypothetical protein Mapa_008009 [Marchantia paleacea]